MDSVGIRELKTHLSRYLKRVRAGTRLLVTEHGRSIATISPVEVPADLSWANQLVAEGRAPLEWRQADRCEESRQSVRQAVGLVRRARGSPMTLCLDTSSAIKLYVAEAGADEVRKLMEGAAVVVT